MINPIDYENHSGGAIGADTAFDNIGRMYGVTKHFHYWYKKMNPKSLPEHEITEEQYLEGIRRIQIANIKLKRNGIEKYMHLLARNWMQVKNSEAIFAISSLSTPSQVSGGTGWAVQMAIDIKKPVYVFDQIKQHWYKFNGFIFVPIDTPILTKKFAGIGTRELNEHGEIAVDELYKNTFK